MNQPDLFIYKGNGSVPLYKGNGSVPLVDAHTHLGSEAERQERLSGNLLSLVCAVSPEEAEAVRELRKKSLESREACRGLRKKSLESCEEGWEIRRKSPEGCEAGLGKILASYGLHPWQAGRFPAASMLDFFEEADAVGELGMDSVWTKVPLDVQEKAFRLQLEKASELKKPVILHTKGQEREIAKIIAEYPNTYYVHWYSSDQMPEDYLDLDCYFSVGPDVTWNTDVQRLAEIIPENRILTETDGLSSVVWAEEERKVRMKAGADAGVDVGKNVEADAGVDVGKNVEADAGRDVGKNVEADAGGKAGMNEDSRFPEGHRGSEEQKQPALNMLTVRESLLTTLKVTALLRGTNPEELRKRVYCNMLQFLRGGVRTE